MKNSLTPFLLLAMFIFMTNCTSPSSEAQDNAQEETVTDSNELADEKETVVKNGSIDIDGFKLKYKRQGQGAPMVVVGSADYYSKAFSEELGKNFELIFIDSRHFVPDCSPSEQQLAQIDLATFSEDLNTVVKNLGLNQFTLVGHSVHAQIALDYASKYPENLNGLVIIGGVAYFDQNFGKIKEKHWNELADKERENILLENMKALEGMIDSIPEDQQFAVSYHHNAPIYWANPKYDASRLLNGLRTCPQLIGKLFGSVSSKKNMIEKMEKLDVPTLIVMGKLDFSIPYKSWEEVIGDNPNIKYVLMDNASHNPQTEASTQQAFNRHLMDWSARLQ